MPLSTARREHLYREAARLAEENRGAPETLRNRSHAMTSWRRFAGRESPTEELVWLYVVDELSKNRKPSGVRTYLAGIKKFFMSRGLTTETAIYNSVRVRETLWQGAARLKKAGHTVKRALVVKEAQVKMICETSSGFDGTLFAALVVAMFFNLTRGAELVLPAHTRSQCSNKIPLFGNVQASKFRTKIRILSQKTAQYRAHDLDYNESNTPRWALATLYKYTLMRVDEQSRLTSFPEFFLRESSQVPTTSWLMRKLKVALGSDYTVHGLRAGGATRLAILGYTAFQIQLAGRWTSDAFLAYVSENESLALALAKRGNLPIARTHRRR